MTNSEQRLRKANKDLKDEVADLKVKLEKVLKELSERTEECKLNVGGGSKIQVTFHRSEYRSPR